MMSDRFKPQVGVLTAGVALIALGGACSAATLLAKGDRMPQGLQLRNEPPRFLYVHCATGGGDGPCALDPAMQRLDVDPRVERPGVAPVPDPLPNATVFIASRIYFSEPSTAASSNGRIKD